MKRNWWRTAAILSFLSAFVSNGYSFQWPGNTGKTAPDRILGDRLLKAIRLSKSRVYIDGLLTEPVWKTAAPAKDFVQQQPEEGKPATEKTEAYVAYDDDAIYVAVYAYDSEPDKIYGQLARRDEEPPSDWIRVGIDSYADRRTAFEFAVNPAGTKVDALWSDDVHRDKNWDAVWDVATRTVDNGWIAEFRIPLSQLRFSTSDTSSWGFQVVREIYRKKEVDFWRFTPMESGRMVSFFGRLTGIRNLPPKHHIEVLPYAVANSEWYPRESGNPFRSGPAYSTRSGADLKFGLASNLTLNATINPDFGQVEADPSEFNLTAYETYFPEKRPFFLEGANIFKYNVGISGGELANNILFYSRRIGRVPQYRPSVPEGGHLKMPRRTTILGAAKLTGKLPNGLTLGFLKAVTREEKATIAAGNRRYKVPVEPLAAYFVGRLQKDFRGGATVLGGIVTHLQRKLPGKEFYFLPRQALSWGVDFSHRWHKNQFKISALLAGSYVAGEKEAIQRLQKSPARYYQRPDAKHVEYDPDRTSLSGMAGKLALMKIGGGHWRFSLGGLFYTPGFEVNDMGFQRLADLRFGFVWVGYRQYVPRHFYRKYGLNLNLWYADNFGGERLKMGGNINADVELKNFWLLGMGVSRENEHWDPFLLRGGPAFRTPGQLNSWFYIESDPRKRIILSANFLYGVDDEGYKSFSCRQEVEFRPTSRLRGSVSILYAPSVSDRQYVSHKEDSSGDHYIFGRLHRKTLAIMTRINLALTPELTLQYYGQPFLSAGWYSHFREIADPRARRYEDRFTPYPYPDPPDFNFKEFRSNLVLRWEYRAGSVLYLVWSQGRNHFAKNGSFRLTRDFARLFDARAENVYLVKINRWFSF